MQNSVAIISTIVAVVLLGVSGYLYFDKQSLEDQLKQTEGELNSVSVETGSILEQGNKSEIETAEALPVCFNEWLDDQYVITSSVDTSSWTSFDGGYSGFKLKYPKGVVVDEVNVISEENSKLKARISVSVLEGEFAVSSINTPRIVYEVFSDTWWKTRDFGYPPDFASAKKCTPNEIGRTIKDSYPIYMLSDGDVGVSVIDYFIIMRTPTEHEPLVIKFTTGSDGNDPGYQGFGEFRDTLEQIIQTIEGQLTIKG